MKTVKKPTPADRTTESMPAEQAGAQPTQRAGRNQQRMRNWHRKHIDPSAEIRVLEEIGA